LTFENDLRRNRDSNVKFAPRAGGSWIGLGRILSLGGAGAVGARAFQRAGAVALAVFAAMLSWSAVASALGL